MKILIIIEHDNKHLRAVNMNVLTAAAHLGSTIDAFIIGHQVTDVIEVAKQLPNVQRILIADHEVYAHQLAENTAALIAEIATAYDYVLVAATTFGKNILPRVAALLDMSMVSDVVSIVSDDTFIRPIYAGNALATVQSTDKLKFISIRTTAFAAASLLSSKQNLPLERIDKVIKNDIAVFKSQQLNQSTRPELTSARVVVSGGRAFKSAENFKMLESLADKLGAAIGASRAAVDAGFAPNDYQVGQTGKIVAPELYIAIGISGAIQHMAGMKDSKVIVAINNDPDAPIFQSADYGLVGDLFTVLPELQEALSKV